MPKPHAVLLEHYETPEAKQTIRHRITKRSHASDFLDRGNGIVGTLCGAPGLLQGCGS
jgi:hypothetical protein